MKLIIGLGNPGKTYTLTRHNTGFMCVDAISRFYQFSPFSLRKKAELTSGIIGKEKVVLLKPQNFMNESGSVVNEIAHFYKVAPKDIIVFHDDLDLKEGQVKIKFSGGHAGHNGLRSIDKYIGTEYWRIRVGIGRPQYASEVVSWVLSEFSQDSYDRIYQKIQIIAENISLFWEKDPSYLGQICL